MKSITIHGLDDILEKLIQKEAKKKGLSLNKTIKALLADSLGAENSVEMNHREDFQEFFGIWNENDVNKFNASVADLEKIDKEDWE